MNQIAFMKVWDKIKEPKFLLTILFFLGLVLNIVYFTYLLLPKLYERQSLAYQADQLEKQMRQLENKPKPVVASVTDIQAALKKVPIDDGMSDFLLLIKQMESLTGVIVTSITNSVEVKKDDFTSILEGGTLPRATNQPLQTNAPTQAGTAGQQSAGTLAFTEQKMNVVVKGSYSQVRRFVDGLVISERLLSVKSVNLTTSVKPIGGGSLGTGGQGLAGAGDQSIEVNGTIIVSYYSAKPFAGRLGDASAPKINLPLSDANVKDPTLSDESFFRMIP